MMPAWAKGNNLSEFHYFANRLKCYGESYFDDLDYTAKGRPINNFTSVTSPRWGIGIYTSFFTLPPGGSSDSEGRAAASSAFSFLLLGHSAYPILSLNVF